GNHVDGEAVETPFAADETRLEDAAAFSSVLLQMKDALLFCACRRRPEDDFPRVRECPCKRQRVEEKCVARGGVAFEVDRFAEFGVDEFRRTDDGWRRAADVAEVVEAPRD